MLLCDTKIMIHSFSPIFGICEIIIRILVNWWADDQVKFKSPKSYQLLKKKIKTVLFLGIR